MHQNDCHACIVNTHIDNSLRRDSCDSYFSSHLFQAEYILDLQKQLTLLGSEARRDQNGGLNDESITTTTTADKVEPLI